MTERCRACLTATALLALLILALWPGAALAQQRGLYFAQTGFFVGGEFADFFESHGGVDIFGYPIGNAITEEGRPAQYFQRARMELHVENPQPYRVQLGLLGSQLYGPPDPPVLPETIPSPTDTRSHYFSETGQIVTGIFWDFFRTRGGLDIFGYPLGGPIVEHGVTAQYFQRARMEWHPENPDPYKVQLGLLGQEWLAKPAAPAPTPPPSPVATAAAAPGGTPTAAVAAVAPSTPVPPTGGPLAGLSFLSANPWPAIIVVAVLLLAYLLFRWRHGIAAWLEDKADWIAEWQRQRQEVAQRPPTNLVGRVRPAQPGARPAPEPTPALDEPPASGTDGGPDGLG
jgi:hypothetical protein